MSYDTYKLDNGEESGISMDCRICGGEMLAISREESEVGICQDCKKVMQRCDNCGEWVNLDDLDGAGLCKNCDWCEK